MVQDHVHMLIRIPPKYSVAEVIGYIKGKSAIAVARQFGGRKRNFNGERFWARGYCVSTVGFEEAQIRAYINHQDQLDSQGSDESGQLKVINQWQPSGLLKSVKPLAQRGRYDSSSFVFSEYDFSRLKSTIALNSEYQSGKKSFFSKGHPSK